MITCNHNSYRELKQLSWVVFGNLDVDINSEVFDNIVKTEVIYNNQKYTDISEYFEKNCIKKSLYKAVHQIKNWDIPWGILTGINPSKLIWDSLDKNELMEKYFVDEFRSNMCVEVIKITQNIKTSPDDFSLYVGIPFCKSKCKYCSFIGGAVDKANKYQSKYVDCLIKELEVTALVAKNRILKSIYVGGGTPTALNEIDLERLLLAITKNFDLSNLIEFTVEAGRVDTINFEKLDIIKKAGVDRISINPQIFDDAILEKIGRNHTSKQVIDTYNYAKTLGFKAINMDIIYGLGGAFEKTVDILLELNPENITIHTLAIKNGGELGLDYTAELSDINYFYEKVTSKNYKPYYLYRQQYMIKPYENVGFYRDNTECYYNICMMENLTDILACGSGTTSKISKKSYYNNKYPLDYINNIENILQNKENLL